METIFFEEKISGNATKEIIIQPVFVGNNLSLDIKKFPEDLSIYYKILGDNWSENKNIKHLEAEENFLDIRIIIYNPNENDREVEMTILYEDTPEKTFDSSETVSYFDVSRFAEISSELEDQFNMFISVNEDLLKVIYYRVKPVESDNIFREHTYKKFFEKKCLNLNISDNKIPSLDEAVMTEWGSEFSTFKADISRKYFEHIFGVGEKPIEDDFMIMLVNDKAFEVRGVSQKENALGETSIYELTIGEYQNKKSRSSENMEEMISSHEKEFGDEMGEQKENFINKKEKTPSYIYKDSQREFISEDVIYSENFMDFGGGDKESLAIKYFDIDGVPQNICLQFVFFNSCKMMNIMGNTLEIQSGNLTLGDKTIIENLPSGENILTSINIHETHLEVVVLNGDKSIKTMKEVFGSIKFHGNSVEIFHDNFEMSLLALAKRRIPTNKSNFVFSKAPKNFSGTFFILDTFKPPKNALDGNQSEEVY